jgi:hypothetical protein
MGGKIPGKSRTKIRAEIAIYKIWCPILFYLQTIRKRVYVHRYVQMYTNLRRQASASPDMKTEFIPYMYILGSRWRWIRK